MDKTAETTLQVGHPADTGLAALRADFPQFRFEQPVCVLLTAVLHFLPADQAGTVAAAFRQALAPGSYLVISSGTSTGTNPALINRLAAYQDITVVTGRPAEEIAAYFTGLHLVPPGLTDVWGWRPDSERYWPPPTARILGAVGRKPPMPTPGRPA